MHSGKLYSGLLLASAMAAENGPGTITGTITDWDGVPLTNAEILAKNVSGVQ